MTEMHNLRTTLTDAVILPKIFQTQVLLFRGIARKTTSLNIYSRTISGPTRTNCPEEQKLKYFQSLIRDNAIEFLQTLKINTETTVTDILQAFNKEYGKGVSQYKFAQMRYNLTVESFTSLQNSKKPPSRHMETKQSR